MFDEGKKRELPRYLTSLGIISSTQAAGYADFIKIINARWGGVNIQVAHTQVQGMDAPDQIMRALDYFNERGEVQVIAILRGGGSADDLACFNDEALVRAVAASRIPVITGIGHEVDESLCDLAADVRASTPSNAAELLVPNRADMKKSVQLVINGLSETIFDRIETLRRNSVDSIVQISNIVGIKIADCMRGLSNQIKILNALNPEKVLERGYAIIRGKISLGNVVKITTFDKEIKAEVKEINERN